MSKLSIILLVLLASLPACPASAADMKIGIVDLRKAWDNYWKKNQADAALRARGNELEEERKTILKQFDKAKTDYKKALDDANDQAVSVEEREKRKKAAEAKLAEMNEIDASYTAFQRQAKTQIDEQNRRMRDKVLEEIRAVVNAKAKAASYSLVIDVSADSVINTPVVLFNNGDNDITDAVIKQLNANAPAGSLKPVDPKPEKAEDRKEEKKK
ncbi:MAG TPA: OmpH family outer membrane protein [Candidatus Eisenbacteria bacterium]|jgi:outer membrane protein|nr:OmpH family outer membrane protein [Candidatus Eisenbacteria bacterium]